MKDPDLYHMWRSFPTKPHWRWAFDVVRDEEAEDGYRITDYDNKVADGIILHEFHEHMGRPAVCRSGDYTAEQIGFVYQGEPDHFHCAVRQFKGLFIGSTGRSA